MCGISGIFRADSEPVDAERVVAMRDAMVRRGPDGFGLSHGPGFALGHRRLAIIDLSEAGQQPMSNEDDTIQIVFNGEIYNFAELRPELEAAGHRFRSRTDTEVLIHGYETWGLEGLLKRIRGMFAFALMDTREGSLHLARDPLGKKPLFFRHADGELAFASSARALALGLKCTPEVDPEAVDDLVWNHFIPGPRTIFIGVEKLQPGHALSLNRDGQRRDFCFWQPDFLHPTLNLAEEEWLERIETALLTAVKRRLVADVPVGILLSGGIDSGLVTALAARATRRVRTFTVASDDADFDESRFAAQVAEHYGTEHHVLTVRASVREDLPRLVAAMGEPLADSSASNVLAIAQLARRSVTVALTGDGGDEAFGGYHHFWAYHVSGRLRGFLPGIFRPHLSKLAAAMQYGPGFFSRAGGLLARMTLPLEKSVCLKGNLDAATRSELFTAEMQVHLNGRFPTDHRVKSLPWGNGALPVDRYMQLYMRTSLPDDFLTKVDLATMGASLEARCPFLDLDLVELGMRIPARLRFRHGQRKGLLRKMSRRFLPHELVNRRKQGFAAPIGRWLGGPHWSELVHDVVLGPQVERRGWFRRKTLERLVNEHRQGHDHGQLLWNLLVLELWIRMNVEQSQRTTPQASRYSEFSTVAG